LTDDRPRAIRVFISSTFRDMGAEREELVGRIFPAIRRLCESRGVTFSEVDLRWGVTDEQKAEGAVLPICLAEIERSRPWFIGLIGERYGWVPDEIPADLAARLGWLKDATGKSVTELEILHGVLNDPGEENHAFFYLRDPAWVDALPAEQRPDFVDDDPSLRSKLDDLKARVRASSFPVRDYPDPIALGELVRADLTALVERLFPEEASPDPLDRDAAVHAAHAASRFSDHVERTALRHELDAFASTTGPPLVVTGETGAGASALVANWLRWWRFEHPDDVLIEHYIGAMSPAGDWRALVARLVGELDRRHGLPEVDPTTLPDDVAGRRAALAAALGRAAATGRRTVVVVDGLDDLDDVDGALELAWLPEVVPDAVRLVVTTDAGRPLDAAVARGWPTMVVPPLTPDERRTLTNTVLARYAKALGASHLERVTSSPLSGNALFLRVVLDELRQHGDHFTLDAVLDQLLAAQDVDDLLEVVLARYERDYERDRPGLVRDAFTALWAGRRGLTEAELLDVLGTGGQPLPHAVWSPLFLAAEHGLVTRSGLFTFASEAHRKAVLDRYLPTPEAQAAAHAVLARWFAAQPLTDRVVEELPWQQLGAGDVDGLVSSLSNLELLERAYRRSVSDVRRLWAAAEAAGRRMGDAYAGVVADPSAVTVDQVWAVARLLTDGGYPAQGLALHRYLVDVSRTDPAAEARLRAALVNLGAAFWQQGDLAAAEPPLVEAIDRCRSAGDRRALQAALGMLAMVRRDRGDLGGAVPLFEEAEGVCRELGDDVGLQASLGDHAQLLRQLGDRDGALVLLVEQERLCRAAGDRIGIARALAGQAVVHADRGESARSIELNRAHDAMCRELGDLRGLAECLLNQAVDLANLGDPAASQTAAGEAEELARRLGDLGLLARILLARASAVTATGN
jgi:tetratricopeptide (TPR) repeat protein